MKTFTFEPVTRDQIKDYCEASGDWNKIHWKEEFAKEAGLPTVIAHGMLSLGLFTRALDAWGFSTLELKNIECKFKGIVFPGDILVAELDETTQRGRMMKQGSSEEILSVDVSFEG